MNIEDIIAKEEKISNEYKESIGTQSKEMYNLMHDNMCQKEADYHMQIAEYLKEIKEYKDKQKEGYILCNINKIIAEIEKIHIYYSNCSYFEGQMGTDHVADMTKKSAINIIKRICEETN